MTLRQTIESTSFEDIHLVHDEIDNDPATIVELNADTLTEAGKEAWADVLEGEVLSVFNGIYGLQLKISGVKASRLDAFSQMLAGYCSGDDYDRWVASDSEPNTSNVFLLPVTWSVCGFVEIKTDTFGAAVEYFHAHVDDIALPGDEEYVDGSFTLSCEDLDVLRITGEEERKRRNKSKINR